MSRAVDPRRRCIALPEWPEGVRAVWQAGVAPRGRFSQQGSATHLSEKSREKYAEGFGRWLVLAAVALATVGIVSLGGRLWHRYRAHSARDRAIATVHADAPGTNTPRADDARSASHALLANRPAPESNGEGRVRVVSATAAAAKPSGSGPGAGASPESQLAATAARHVLSGNYAEALPVYRQLERTWPENTSYAAMSRLLEKKVGSRNDTRTVAPATPAAHPAEP